MEKTSSTTLSPFFSLAGLGEVLFFDAILKQVASIQKLYSSSQSFFQSQLDFISGKSNTRFERKFSNALVLNQKSFVKENEDDEKLTKEDVKMVMAKFNIVLSQGEDHIDQERLGVEELSVVFGIDQPSLVEVKEAFDVFDENKDGFIDARELQKVLSSLGIREGSEVAACEKMIRVFDENRDGLIDFHEFVKLMENSFC